MKLLAALIFTFSQGVVANEECTALGNTLPCTDSGNKFATKTITEKYRLMKQCGWTKTDRLAQFCPYQTALCGEQARIHFWPECANDYTSDTVDTDDCIDHRHMFDWMVNDLTGLAPADFYLCVPNHLSVYGARIQQPISGTFDFSDFAVAKKGCNDAGGKVVFNHQGVKEVMDDWSGSGTGQGTGKVFGMSMVEYCVYTPGLTLNKMCRDACIKETEKVNGEFKRLCKRRYPSMSLNKKAEESYSQKMDQLVNHHTVNKNRKWLRNGYVDRSQKDANC